MQFFVPKGAATFRVLFALASRTVPSRAHIVPLVGLLVAGGSISARAQADPPSIDGSIQFNGGATLNGDLQSATAFSTIYGPGGTGTLPVVLGGSTSTGDYSTVPDGTLVTFQAFSFASSAPIVSLWAFTIGTTAYSFDASTVTVASQSQFFLDIKGDGTAHITGYADTPGTWEITDTGDGGLPSFTFGAATTATPAPEPSTVVLLLAPLPMLLLVFRARGKAAHLKNWTRTQ